MSFDFSQSISLVRPGFDTLEDGVYTCKLSKADILEMNAGVKLRVRGMFANENNDVLEESLIVAPDWKPDSVFRKLLELAQCLPGRNERLDTNALANLTFLFTIKMNVKNGKEYPNLVDVALPPDEE